MDAALSEDRAALYPALLACPYVHDMKVAKTNSDDLMAAYADRMPQFKVRLRVH